MVRCFRRLFALPFQFKNSEALSVCCSQCRRLRAIAQHCNYGNSLCHRVRSKQRADSVLTIFWRLLTFEQVSRRYWDGSKKTCSHWKEIMVVEQQIQMGHFQYIRCTNQIVRFECQKETILATDVVSLVIWLRNASLRTRNATNGVKLDIFKQFSITRGKVALVIFRSSLYKTTGCFTVGE